MEIELNYFWQPNPDSSTHWMSQPLKLRKQATFFLLPTRKQQSKKMTSKVRLELNEDLKDSYHTFMKYVLFIPTISYLVGFLVTAHVVDENNVAVAKDGLRMPLKMSEELPEWKLHLHSYCAMVLLCICLYQKEVSVKALSRNYAANIFLHRNLGRLALFCILGMDLGGFLMSEHSSLYKFNVFIFFFAAPFLVFGLGLYFTASAEKIEYHRLFANMLLKGCIGTPLARLGGSVLQNYFSFEDSRGYYVGIFAVAFVLGIWQVVELWHFVVNQS